MCNHPVIQRFSLSVWLLIVCCLGSRGDAQEAVRLQWKWNPGDRLGMQIRQQMKISIDSSDNSQTSNRMQTNNTTTTWMTWEVVERDADGTATIESVVDRIAMETVGPGGRGVFDTDTPPEEGKQGGDAGAGTIARNLRPLVGARTTHRITSRGEVQMVRVGIDLETKLANIGGEQYVKVFKDVSRNATLLFPEEPLKIGDSWDKKLEMATPMGAINLVSTYTYQGIDQEQPKPLHKFNVDVTMEFVNPALPIEIKRQDTTGVLYFDAEAGRVDYSQVRQEVELAISVNGRLMTQNMTQTTTVRISPR
jgi:hypothetical protein